MVHCLQTTPSELLALDQDRARLNWQEQHNQQLVPNVYTNGSHIGDLVPLPTSIQALDDADDHDRSSTTTGYIHGQIGIHDNGWLDLTRTRHPIISNAKVVEEERNTMEEDHNSRKRKVENIYSQEVVTLRMGCGNTAKDGMKEGTEKGGGEAAKESKQATSKREASRNASKENMKSPMTDYIQVRARRGQATDSHSLAERMRRERISERMKYLQDLVPGCHKVTGKASMLDEIINYVQSLQRQVEFLSMKLAAVNPRLDFNVDNFSDKEINLAFNPAVMPTIDTSTEQSNPSYIQLNSLHPTAASCGFDMALMGSLDRVLGRTMQSPASVPDTILDSSLNVHAASPSSSSWDTGLQNLYGVEYHHQGRRPDFPFGSLQGDILPSSLKTEM